MPDVSTSKSSSGKIFGYNLLIFAVYISIGLVLDAQVILFAFILAIAHGVFCMILSKVKNNRTWLFTGILILAAGAGICLSTLNVGNIH